MVTGEEMAGNRGGTMNQILGTSSRPDLSIITNVQ
jgi:hypothetical protein